MSNLKFTAATAALLAFGSFAQAETLTIATVGEPASLDQLTTHTDLVIGIVHHMFETLYTYTDTWDSRPLLAADMPTVSEDGLTYTIPLRQGVTFHDGSTFEASDVIASLERWMKLHSKGKQVAEYVESLTAKDDYTVEIKLKSRYAPLVATLSQASTIHPSETIADELTQFIGTGPFMLKERRPDQFVQLVKFDGYTSPEGEVAGLSGKREVSVDELLFVPVPDANTRVEGLISGQYDFADSLPFSAYDRLNAAQNVSAVLYPSSSWMSFNVNHKEGLLTQAPLRRAVQIALNQADMMAAAFDREEFYSLGGSIFPPTSVWATEEGAQNYNLGDTEGAAKLLAEAGYDGTPLRILTSRQYEYHYKAAEVAKAYLEAAGFKVELNVVDWATLVSLRSDATQWDIFITHSNFPGDPTTINTLNDAYAGWWASEAKTAALAAYMDSTSEDEKKAAWANIQTVLYDEVPLVKIGNFNALTGVSSAITGYEPTYWPHFWNVTVSR